MRLTFPARAGVLAASMLAAPAPLFTLPQARGAQDPSMVISSMAGRDLFNFYCASCHGRDGKGGGHVAAALKVPPPDLTTMAQRNKGIFPAERVEVIVKGDAQLATPAHGSSEMPVWGPIFRALDARDAVNAARIENIVGHIRTLQVKAKAAPEAGG